jgi:hypothetical protein
MKSLFGLPENQRPSSTVELAHVATEKKVTIFFGSDGICDACRFHEEKTRNIDWDAREKQLIALCDKYRRSSGYDVVDRAVEVRIVLLPHIF